MLLLLEDGVGRNGGGVITDMGETRESKYLVHEGDEGGLITGGHRREGERGLISGRKKEMLWLKEGTGGKEVVVVCLAAWRLGEEIQRLGAWHRTCGLCNRPNKYLFTISSPGTTTYLHEEAIDSFHETCPLF